MNNLSLSCMDGKRGLGRVSGALGHSTVTIAPLRSWGLQRKQAEEFECSSLGPAWLHKWKLRSPGWSLTGAGAGLECNRQPWISWLNCTYSSYSQQWIFSVWSRASELSALLPGCHDRSVWTGRERHSAGEGCGAAKCDRGVMNASGGGYEPGAAVLLWSAGLILPAHTGQDSHPGRGQNEGYMMLNLINFNRMLPWILLPYCGTCTY